MPRPPIPSALDPQSDGYIGFHDWPPDQESLPDFPDFPDAVTVSPCSSPEPTFGDYEAKFRPDLGDSAQTKPLEGDKSHQSTVWLHVYDVGVSGQIQVLNKVLRPLSLGAFHCGVEVHGWEWSYRDTSPRHKDPAVFSSMPMRCRGHTYIESVNMGVTRRGTKDVTNILQLMHATWPGNMYDILNRNCCHFCEELCKFLGVGAIPTRLLNLASVGQALAGSLIYLDERRQALASQAMEMPEKLDPSRMFEIGCCRRISKARPGDPADDSEDHVADVIEQIPSAPPSRHTRSASGGTP